MPLVAKLRATLAAQSRLLGSAVVAGALCGAASPLCAQTPNVKTIFTNYRLLGTYSWDCSKPPDANNIYYVLRAIDDGHVQGDRMSSASTRDWVAIMDVAIAWGPTELFTAGERDGKRSVTFWNLEPGRIQFQSWPEGSNRVDLTRFPDSVSKMRWLTHCDEPAK